ncbi:MAG: hypothetical protein ACXAEF_02820 [Candidatus Thorarchaeota archaeon]
MNQSDSRVPYYILALMIIISLIFTFIIWSIGPFIQTWTDQLIPDQGVEWYYWKLPTRSDFVMIIVWTLYLSHQILIWGAIYWASKNLKDYRTTGMKLSKYNYSMLIITVVFMALHIVKTIFIFDGLAQDVPIWTSQGSVILMLVIVLVIENPRRGFFMGKKPGKPFTAQVSGFFRRNHSYIISWALVYTFWFHPAVNDPQLVSGFFFMFLLFTQMILAYTPVHLDKRWIITLESWVAIHAVFVAVYNTIDHGSTDMWAMFFSGFAFMFVFTYMYALDMKKQYRWAVTVIYFAFLAWVYLPTELGGYGRDITFLLRLEFLWIPIILYLLGAVLAGLAYLYLGRTKKSSDLISDSVEN